MNVTRRTISLAVAIAAAVCLPAVSFAADWPSRQVTILVPTAAGGNTDLMARMAADYLSHKLGQPFVVENRPSAGGALTSTQVSTAEPDGHTILFAPHSMALLVPLVQKITFDPSKLVPVTNVGTGSQVVAVRRELPVKSLPEFIAHAKANPGKLNFAIAGANNISHLGPALLFKRAGIELVMVPARGEPQAITDLMAGNADLYFGNASVLLAQRDHEKLRILAVGTAQRIAAAPDLPTVAETLPGFEFASWNGFFVPAGTPDSITGKLRDEIAAFVKSPEVTKRLTGLGIVPGGMSKEEVARVFEKDRTSFAEAVAAAGIPKP
jgi:tripartite-type tricarboxylate transporter receptor subunit TctC